jgi:hypothetical protein
MLYPHDVAKRVTEIEALAQGDPEAARSKERELYLDVLKTICSGCDYPVSLARTALQAEKIVGLYERGWHPALYG